MCCPCNQPTFHPRKQLFKKSGRRRWAVKQGFLKEKKRKLHLWAQVKLLTIWSEITPTYKGSSDKLEQNSWNISILLRHVHIVPAAGAELSFQHTSCCNSSQTQQQRVWRPNTAKKKLIFINQFQDSERLANKVAVGFFCYRGDLGKNTWICWLFAPTAPETLFTIAQLLFKT